MKKISASWTPKFPSRAYAIVLTLSKKHTQKSILYPLRRLCKTQNQIDRCIDEFQTALRKDHPSHVVKFVYVIEIRFFKTWNLKPEYWTAPGPGFDEQLRDKLFHTFINQYSMRQTGWLMLITPDSKSGKTEHFTVPMPLKLVSREADTEAFLKYSNWPVHPTATHVAMYTVDNVFEYELVLKSNQRRAH